ncbi:uncharacterized protein LOC110271526 [Arachis ipaensis]|uniref:uncharacterized protein LOC110271526 n=1 Tax=Arachis ipaensis TaxID=130454 RepID=UPI000A2B1E9A|nr:uncharacterized protein LOC110271526 [Arachis ipaensis]
MPPPLCHRRRDRRRGRGPQGRGRVTPPSAGLHAANVAGVVAMRKRARQTVAELSLPPCPAAVGSPAVAHGVTPVSFCCRKMPLLRRRRILPLLLSEIRAVAIPRELLAELLPGCRQTGL